MDGENLGLHGASMADTGCDLAPRCLSCPLPICVEDFNTSDAAKYKSGIRAIRFLQRFEAHKAVSSPRDAIRLQALSENIGIHAVYSMNAKGRKWRERLGWDGSPAQASGV